MAEYPKPEEAYVSWTEVESMRVDPSLVVVTTMKEHNGDNYIVIFWRKARGVFPPWVKIAA